MIEDIKRRAYTDDDNKSSPVSILTTIYMIGREYDSNDLLKLYDDQPTETTSSDLERDDRNDTSDQYATSDMGSQSTYEELYSNALFKSSQYLSMLDYARLAVSYYYVFALLKTDWSSDYSPRLSTRSQVFNGIENWKERNT